MLNTVMLDDGRNLISHRADAQTPATSSTFKMAKLHIYRLALLNTPIGIRYFTQSDIELASIVIPSPL